MANTDFVIYDLAAADPDLRISPHCWKTRMAVVHKGLSAHAQFLPWRFTEKERVAFSGQKLVPVMVQGDLVLADSWKIALHLEATYPDTPSLFVGPEAVPLTAFINDWSDTILLPAIARVILMDIYERVAEKDRAYFRATREKRFGMSLEDVVADREGNLKRFREVLWPLRKLLHDQPYVAGATAAYADYCVFGMFMWSRCSSPLELLAKDDPIVAWRNRLLDAFEGFARSAPSVAD